VNRRTLLKADFAPTNPESNKLGYYIINIIEDFMGIFETLNNYWTDRQLESKITIAQNVYPDLRIACLGNVFIEKEIKRAVDNRLVDGFAKVGGVCKPTFNWGFISSHQFGQSGVIDLNGEINRQFTITLGHQLGHSLGAPDVHDVDPIRGSSIMVGQSESVHGERNLVSIETNTFRIVITFCFWRIAEAFCRFDLFY